MKCREVDKFSFTKIQKLSVLINDNKTNNDINICMAPTYVNIEYLVVL